MRHNGEGHRGDDDPKEARMSGRWLRIATAMAGAVLVLPVIGLAAERDQAGPSTTG